MGGYWPLLQEEHTGHSLRRGGGGRRILATEEKGGGY